MHTRRYFIFVTTLVFLVLLTYAPPCGAQDGKLKIRANPREAYIFVDGRALREARGAVRLSPGNHEITLYNYGYKSVTRNVSITAGKTTALDIALEPIPGTVSGPWGCITLEGANRAAVLLNGKTPDYFVGHGDEFNHEWWWKQELIVPSGTHQLTVVRDGQELWSGSVEVPANQRVVVDAHKGAVRKTVPWPRGERLGAQPPFKAGTASATVAIAPVSATLAASPGEINCGESARLTWSTAGAVRTEITEQGQVAASGEQTVQPKQTTTYSLKASGPGGVASQEATVRVNTGVQASFNIAPSEIRYRRQGDKVLEQGTATLTWAAAGADVVSLDPFGSVPATGSRTVQPVPAKTDVGAIDETVTYTFRATNVCGGSETRTARLHITGMIEPVVVETSLEVALALNSIYFPTDLPSARDPQGGLVASQQRVLATLATNFKKYLELRPEAKLIIQANADRRGSRDYNMALSERRSARVKNYLIEQGVPPASLETASFGSERRLTSEEVKQLMEQNPDLTPEDRKKLLKNWRAFLLANNRRVDIVLSTTQQQSKRFFPLNVADFEELLSEQSRARPVLRKTTTQ